jgi:hypothetical protein
MMFKWETERERTLRLMKISPRRKLEWLQQMHDFLAKCSNRKHILATRDKLRDM